MSALSFGEEYQGMSDREILIEMATEQRTMKSDIENLRTAVGNIRCPSPKCAEHEKAIAKNKTAIEVLQANEANEDKANDDRLVVYGIVFSTSMSALAIVAAVWMWLG